MKNRTYLFCTVAWALIAGINLAQGAWVVGLINLAVVVVYGQSAWSLALDADKATQELANGAP